MKKCCNFFLLFTFFSAKIFAQVSITNGLHVLEISGTLSTYYNYRELKPGEFDKKKNRFNLRDAALTFEGRVQKVFGYQLQVDFADLVQNAAGNVDYENPGLMDAFIYANLHPNLRLTAGYFKLPYSFGSLTPFSQSPYWQRAEFIRGDFFSRRDVGAMLSTNLLNRKVEILAGVFNGTGEIALGGDNDPSGQVEYVGRISFSYPARYRRQIIDTRVSPIPFFNLGLNYRYTERNLPEGERFIQGSTGEYGLKMINGTKSVSGADFSFHFKGLSLQAEVHVLKGTPTDTNSVLLGNSTIAQNKGYFRSGCEILQLSYFVKKINAGLSVRYDNMNVNDLYKGTTTRVTYAVFYFIKGTSSMIKANYTTILNEDIVDPLKYNAQFRIGWQWLFH